jgi:hypothetical protein
MELIRHVSFCLIKQCAEQVSTCVGFEDIFIALDRGPSTRHWSDADIRELVLEAYAMSTISREHHNGDY